VFELQASHLLGRNSTTWAIPAHSLAACLVFYSNKG
jgi:hypothetical protein